MDANMLQSLFSEGDAHKEEIYDRAADRFLSEVYNELTNRYNNDEWAEFVGCTQLGISLQKVDTSFKEFMYSFGWILKEETLEKDYEMKTFDLFFFGWPMGRIRKDCECCGYQGSDVITTLHPFVKALKRKGFEVYYDEDNMQLVVALNITYDQK